MEIGQRVFVRHPDYPGVLTCGVVVAIGKRGRPQVRYRFAAARLETFDPRNLEPVDDWRDHFTDPAAALIDQSLHD